MQSVPDDPLNRPSYNQDEDRSQIQGRLQKKNHRPRMSCNQCRFRKIRCDRVYPCAACCTRGKPKDCTYPSDANNKAIDQAQEIKSLRKQVQELQREISELQSSGGETRPQYSYTQSTDGPATSSGRSRFPTAQTRPSSCDKRPADSGQNMYYNTPPSSSMRTFSDAEGFSCYDESDNKNERWVYSLAYPFPRSVDVYAYQDAAADPFPSLWQSSLGVGQLLHLLPPMEDLFFHLEAFQDHLRAFYSYQLSTKEIRHFFTDLSGNAERNPQMLAFVFASMARAAPLAAFKKHGGWVQGTMEEELSKADIYMAASMHALRLSSFMNRPTILCIVTLLLMGPYLVNTGKFLDAYTLFGVTVRVAQGMGLYQNPEDISPRPSAQECHLRQNIWWRMLFIDQYYAKTLGRPLGISTMGNMPLQSSYMWKSGDPACISRLDTYTTKFTALSRQIISCTQLTNAQIDEFTDSLIQLHDILPPEERFDQSWLSPDTQLPQWPSNLHGALLHSNMHNYLILLNRRRQESGYFKKSPPGGVQATPDSVQLRGYARVISSCHEVLSAFLLLRQRIPIGLTYWEIGQDAFNAAMILGLNILETKDFTDLRAVVDARDIFSEMQAKQICQAAKLAVSRLDMVLDATKGNGTTPDEKVMSNRGMILAEDPEIRGAVGETYTPITLRSADDGKFRPNTNNSRLPSASPNVRYTDADRKNQRKEEIDRRVDRFGGSPRYRPTSRAVDGFQCFTGSNKNPQTVLPFPSTMIGRGGDKRSYNTGVNEPRKYPRIDHYPQESSGVASVCTTGDPTVSSYIYSRGAPSQYHQQPGSYPSTEPGSLGYAFSKDY